MRTRSQTRNRPQQQVPPNIEPFNLEEPIENQAPPVVTMADQRTMAQLLQEPTEGYEDAIVVPCMRTRSQTVTSSKQVPQDIEPFILKKPKKNQASLPDSYDADQRSMAQMLTRTTEGYGWMHSLFP
ncbi:hypothetical protein Tco_0778871 [Tanacetum coccineum]